MTKFMCELGRVTVPSDVAIVPHIPVRPLLNEIKVEGSGLWVKQIAFYNAGGPRPVSRRPDENKKNTAGP